jgi:predicted phosphoribosyltransferase
MRLNLPENVTDLPELRQRVRVFADRSEAGRVLAGMLTSFASTDALVLGIPSGGVPVAAEIAGELHLALDVAVASKITPPWNTEIGYGAVAFDGTVVMNEDFRDGVGLSEAEVVKGVEIARQKVRRRLELYRANRPMPDCGHRCVILVDDGLASGITTQAAVQALRGRGVGQLLLAVPTGHEDSLRHLAKQVTHLYCANVRGGSVFAVAEAYSQWADLTEDEVMQALREFEEIPKR